MKNGKRLTVKQSNHLKSIGLNPAAWLLCKRAPDAWTLQHRETGQLKEVVSA